jgi:VWFA-related protein
MRHRHLEPMGKRMNATNYRTITWGWLAGLTAVVSCLFFFSQLAGQTPSPQAPATETDQQPGPAIKAESRLVLVDAVVTDKKGNYVHDLTKDDFKVYEDDKKQTVTSFSFGADAAIQPQEQKRYLILFFDNSTMSKVDQMQAKAAAIKFIDANAGPDRLMAVVEFGGVLRTAQSFTADADLLRAAATGVENSVLEPNSKMNAEAEYGARAMLLSVRTLARNLSGFPGRKMVVLFSSGFVLDYTTRLDLMDAISDCNKANVAVYVLDARALLASPPGASSLLQHGEEDQRAVAARFAETKLYGGAQFVQASYSAPIPDPQRPGGGGGTGGGGTGGGGTGGKGGSGGTGAGPASNANQAAALAALTPPTTILPSFPPSVTIHQQVLSMVAGGTGGFTIFNTNDLLGGLEKIARERNEFYILGYAPPITREGSCHTLKVTMSHRGLIVRSRSGYCNTKPTTVVTVAPAEKLLEARATGTQEGTMRGSFQVPYFYTARYTARVNLTMEVPSNTIRFKSDNGKYHATLDVLGIASKPDGSVGARFIDTVNLDLEKDGLAEFTKQPYIYQNQFDAEAGSYRLTVVVSSGNDAFGKYESPLQIDPYDGYHLALGGVVLGNSVQHLGDIPADVGPVIAEDRTPLVVKGKQINPSASNRFKKTDTVALYTEVYEPLLTSANPPQLAAGYTISERASGKTIFTTGAAPLDAFIQKGNPKVPVAMSVPVKDLAPGGYRLVMMAVDSVGHHAQNRSIDFDIAE